jgi:hypothetical protein
LERKEADRNGRQAALDSIRLGPSTPGARPLRPSWSRPSATGLAHSSKRACDSRSRVLLLGSSGESVDKNYSSLLQYNYVMVVAYSVIPCSVVVLSTSSTPTEHANRWGSSAARTITGWLRLPPPPPFLSASLPLSHSVTLAPDGIGSHRFVMVPEAYAPSAPWLGSTAHSSPTASASASSLLVLCLGSRPSCCSCQGVVPPPLPSPPLPTSSSSNNFVCRPHSSGHGQSSAGQIRASFDGVRFRRVAAPPPLALAPPACPCNRSYVSHPIRSDPHSRRRGRRPKHTLPLSAPPLLARLTPVAAALH